jgi:hypothetical protein
LNDLIQFHAGYIDEEKEYQDQHQQRRPNGVMNELGLIGELFRMKTCKSSMTDKHLVALECIRVR